MEKTVNVGLVGCGFMGTRHLYGFQELNNRDLKQIRLKAVCDLKADRSENVATLTKAHLGYRPAVYTDIHKMLNEEKELDAVDIVVDPAFHHTLADIAFRSGKHVLIEKPMGITVKACIEMVDSARKHGKILAVAENYRRDPLNRLVKAALDTDVIGKPFMVLQHLVEGGGKIAVSPWRHIKERGGILLDMGAHYADLLRYFFGEVEQVTGKMCMFEKIRKGIEVTGWPAEIRAKMEDKSAKVKPTVEDTALGILEFKNGVLGQWITSLAGNGKSLWQRIIYGSEGSIDAPLDRSGNPLYVHLKDGTQLSGLDVLKRTRNLPYEEITRKIFPEGLHQYRLPFQEADRRLIAIELYDFAEAVLYSRKPEVNGNEGLKAVALTYAILESAFLNSPVKVKDVENGKISGYQQEINEAWNIPS